MGISFVSGSMLNEDLTRTTDLAFNGNLIYLDVNSNRVGINTSTPNDAFEVVGNILVGNVIISNTGNINAGNVNINNLANPIENQDGATKYYIDQAIANVGGSQIGNLIYMGTNTQGALVSNAVTLTTTTYVTDGITLLNQVLGKLVPPSPPAFPNSTTLAVSSLSTYRMCNFVQTDNTPGANKSVAGGTSVSTVRRASSYTTNTISNTGPGDSGTLAVYLNGVESGNVAFNENATPSANGTYGGNLTVTNNYDYHIANASIAAGFWYVFTSGLSGAVTEGWNEVYIADSVAGNTNTPVWYYDSSSPGTPQFTSTTIAPTSNSLSYTSTIPHYTSSTTFTIGFDVNRLSGNMYPTSDTFATGTARGAFQAPVSRTYAQASVTTPLAQNLYVSSGTATVSTTVAIISGFGSNTNGPNVTVTNSYASGVNTFSPGATVLFKTGNATAINEGNVVVTSVGTGSGNAYRITNPGSGDTPAYTGSETQFDSENGPLQTYDATVVGTGTAGVLKHDQTNYTTGYLPAGPNLSSGRTGTQYFTIKFVRTDVSKFDITYAGNVAGMWVALPGSTIDSTSGANGWIDMTQAYGGAGVPGSNTGLGGNGSDGCSLGGTVVPNVLTASTSKTCTFGTVSSSDTASNEIYIRVALSSGQTVTGLSLKAASN